ncbi:AraC family transcriptional regulator, partial [Mycobacterium tuberculosis]|nr:AraC family transcriptional regulator [Mycobacterium tuberculosis]
GRKRTMLGDEVYYYDKATYLTVSVDLPIVGHVIEASEDEPYLSLRLDLDPTMLSALLLEAPKESFSNQLPDRGMSLNPMGPD